MKDFLVHLYIEEHCFTDTLSALYERSKDLVLSVREVSYRLFLPVFVEDGQFVIEERKQAKLLIGDQPVKSRRVMHGDLITVILENGTSYHLLMQSLQNFPLHTEDAGRASGSPSAVQRTMMSSVRSIIMPPGIWRSSPERAISGCCVRTVLV